MDYKVLDSYSGKFACIARRLLGVSTTLLFLTCAAAAHADDALLGCYSLDGPSGQASMGVTRDETGRYFRVTFGDRPGRSRLSRGTEAQWFFIVFSDRKVLIGPGVDDPVEAIAQKNAVAYGGVRASLTDDSVYIALLKQDAHDPWTPHWGRTSYLALLMKPTYVVRLAFKVPCPV